MYFLWYFSVLYTPPGLSRTEWHIHRNLVFSSCGPGLRGVYFYWCSPHFSAPLYLFFKLRHSGCYLWEDTVVLRLHIKQIHSTWNKSFLTMESIKAQSLSAFSLKAPTNNALFQAVKIWLCLRRNTPTDSTQTFLSFSLVSLLNSIPLGWFLWCTSVSAGIINLPCHGEGQIALEMKVFSQNETFIVTLMKSLTERQIFWGRCDSHSSKSKIRVDPEPTCFYKK